MVALLAACFLLGLPLLAQQPSTVDSNLPLFVVMAAINAAGYDAGLDSPHASPVRRMVRQQIAAARPASLEALRSFYAAHRRPDAARDLSQFISFALLIGAPPDFPFRVKEPELPPDVSALRDLRPLLAAFYQEADLEALWERYRPAYGQELERYNEGLGQLMLEVNGYLRIATSGFLGRNFWVYVDLLGAPGQGERAGLRARLLRGGQHRPAAETGESPPRLAALLAGAAGLQAQCAGAQQGRLAMVCRRRACPRPSAAQRFPAVADRIAYPRDGTAAGPGLIGRQATATRKSWKKDIYWRPISTKRWRNLNSRQPEYGSIIPRCWRS